MSQKSYDSTPSLYLVPTPIGNMEDITLRAIHILEKVEVIFCEDTRVTALLLNYLNIKKKLISSHLYNEEKNKEKLLSYLKNGFDVGLVSDRGTPIISDPGYVLARYTIENGYNVIGLPGPTALISALIMSGLPPMPFYFYGFLSNKGSKRRKELESLKDVEATLIFYESPHRIDKTLEDILEILGNRSISISREISKKYEEIYRGTVTEIQKQLLDIKGEFVIVLEPGKSIKKYDNLTLTEHINLLIEMGNKKNDAIKEVSKLRNLKRSDVYKEFHRSD